MDFRINLNYLPSLRSLKTGVHPQSSVPRTNPFRLGYILFGASDSPTTAVTITWRCSSRYADILHAWSSFDTKRIFVFGLFCLARRVLHSNIRQTGTYTSWFPLMRDFCHFALERNIRFAIATPWASWKWNPRSFIDRDAIFDILLQPPFR